MMITRLLSALIAGAAVATATSVGAADLANDSYYQNSVSPAVYDWTGPYFGAHVGYGWGEAGTGDLGGWVGGVQAGYNMQSGSIVYGVEGDIGISNISGDYTGSIDASIDALGSVRGRIGVTVDQFLLYGTGGFSFARISVEDGTDSDENWALGWVLGIGAEAQLTANWTARVEAFYYDLGSDSYAVSGTPDFGTDAFVVRAGVNYRF